MQSHLPSRRAFLTQALTASCLLSQEREADQVVARTRSGAVRGLLVNGTRMFRGVPFAAPPVGPLRFRPPAPPQSWQGERDATHFASAAMQWGQPKLPQSEDCLYLNVWAPEGSGPFPVFVWIHGGGFTGGHSFDAVTDGSQFAREGVVCVTVAYRLGAFGFLNLAPLLGSRYAASSNNALLDIMAALQWVQRNAEVFGGDPKRVTVGGQSAGAKLTGLLMGLPAAQPLFSQMVLESGGAERIWPKLNSEAVAKGFGEQWRKRTGKDNHAVLTASADELLDTQHAFIETWPQHFPFRAEIDGRLFKQAPVKTIAAGSTKGKRLLIGTNRDESASFIGPHPTHDASAGDLGNVPLPKFQQVYERYSQIFPGLTEEQRRIRAVTAEEYWVPSTRVADAHTAGGGSAWMYRLDFTESTGRLKDYAFHGLETGMVWNHPHIAIDNASEEAALTASIHAAWTAFIQGKTPSAPRLPPWSQYNPKTRSTMILDRESRMQDNPNDAELRLWDGIL